MSSTPAGYVQLSPIILWIYFLISVHFTTDSNECEINFDIILRGKRPRSRRCIRCRTKTLGYRCREDIAKPVADPKRHFWQYVNKSKKSEISTRSSLSSLLLLFRTCSNLLRCARLLGGTPAANWLPRAKPLSIGLSRGKAFLRVVPMESLAGRKTRWLTHASSHWTTQRERGAWEPAFRLTSQIKFMLTNSGFVDGNHQAESLTGQCIVGVSIVTITEYPAPFHVNHSSGIAYCMPF